MSTVPGSARYYTELGKVHIRSEDEGRKALPDLKKAHLIDSSYVEAIAILAVLVSKFATTSTEYSVALKYINWANVILPRNASIMHFRGLFQRNMGRKDLALADFARASSLRPGWLNAARNAATTAIELGEQSIALTHIERCLEIDPHHSEMRLAKSEMERGGTPRDRKFIARFPDALDEMSDFPVAITKHLLDTLTFPRVLSASSRIFAAGSCFASNIAKVLNDQGYTAIANDFGESINSTMANREYFDWLCAEEPYESELSKLISNDERGKIRTEFLKSDVIILTVGVAPVFLEKATGKLRLQTDEGLGIRRLLRDCEFRTLSVTENVTHISHILETIRTHRPRATVFVTLSPVPLNATFEYPSAVIADCVSKSVLRVAVDEVMRQQPENVHYWPAFEAVRWIGGYSGDAYGKEDGSTRHVSTHIVQAITSEFIDRTKTVGA